MEAQREVKLQSQSRCHNPKRLVLDDGRVVYVPCGHCKSCLQNKELRYVDWISKECQLHKYSLFVTMTYDNDHVPYYTQCSLEDVQNEDAILDDASMTMVVDKGLCYKSNRDDAPYFSAVGLDYNTYEKSKLGIGNWHNEQALVTTDADGHDVFPYVCKSDIQKFIKKLRQKILRKYGEKTQEKDTQGHYKRVLADEFKIRYFIASEYGPCTYRPHYHGIIWFDSEELLQDIDEILYSSWQKCDKDNFSVELVNSSAPQYVAKYVSGYVDLPKVLGTKLTKPFNVHSKSTDSSIDYFDFEKVQEIISEPYMEYPVRENGKDAPVLRTIPLEVLNRYFPKCKGYSESSITRKLSVYGQFRDIEERTGERYQDVLKKNGIKIYKTYTTDDEYYRIAFIDNDSNYRISRRYAINQEDINPQDIKAAKACYKWCQHFGITTREYVLLLDNIYHKRAMYNLRSYFEQQSLFMENNIHSKDFTPLQYLVSFDMDILNEFPNINKFGLEDSLKNKLKPFGIDPNTLYDERGRLDNEKIWQLHYSNSPVYSITKKRLEDYYDNSQKHKKYNDAYNKTFV